MMGQHEEVKVDRGTSNAVVEVETQGAVEGIVRREKSSKIDGGEERERDI